MLKDVEEDFKGEQIKLLSGQLEILVNNAVWDKQNKMNIVNTARKIRTIIECSKNNGNGHCDEAKKFVNILTKAKVKAVMSNDCDYYGLCTELDSIISKVSKWRNE